MKNGKNPEKKRKYKKNGKKRKKDGNLEKRIRPFPFFEISVFFQHFSGNFPFFFRFSKRNPFLFFFKIRTKNGKKTEILKNANCRICFFFRFTPVRVRFFRRNPFFVRHFFVRVLNKLYLPGYQAFFTPFFYLFWPKFFFFLQNCLCHI